MALRHLVTGQNNCAPDGASSSNPLNALANAFLGQSSKAQSIKELPGSVSVPSTSGFSAPAPLSNIPGSENEFKQDQRPFVQGSDFIHGGPANDWIKSFRPPGVPELGGIEAHFPDFEQIYNNAGTTFQPPLDGPPQRVLSGVLHSFLTSGPAGVPFQPLPVPAALGLSESDKQCIRDRSCIMARHIFSDQPEEYIQAQVNTLLHSLDIDNRMRGPMHGQYPELQEYWNQSQSSMGPALMHNTADKWITEFGKQNNNPENWAKSFEQQYGPNGWASEFEQHQSQMAMGQMGGVNMANLAAMEQSRMLAQTLASNNDPKFQLSQGADKWVSEFSSQHNQGALNESWVDEFSKLNVTDEWAEEFSGGGFGESSADPWVDEFQEHLSSFKQSSGASRGVYVYSENNPYVGHPNPMQEGQELFRKGLLSEAVLALEAEVLKNPDNAEGWRLLGITHAENDDDQQAIAAMMRALEANPTNLEVLLALGVSHTNELEQGEALRYLYRWLQNHPKYGGLVPPQSTDSPYGPDVVRLFNDAAQMSPEDADVHVVLGVLYNLSREYDKAITSFKTAVQLKPQDYSLWNKLGATQANSIQSADAILAYQQALDLKPNYVRAWANMGISYANQGLYEDSIRYYVRAVTMNPKADNAWQYLRISLGNASRADMIAACDARNLDALQKEFPL
ncbi:peroxisome biogenesis protein 5 isoform X3 [Zea mays]|uniref:Peroxisome biogenesis protein 5 n=1 Tax=Zea mays TaxID=4577 RepID=A0A1D6QKG5_MAIZE|nr:peroxisome biogenesis protein 5 isoform X3 [Zea mays]AQK58222.1 Peroxisome biogenesis protein 5 [Zea mays]AQK58225.1 Peroxisome biogenesis protein 5 [Zea mays]|eukprot:XP_008679528.1 peroxisome biogenesis protein 5 isoform X3 [Zea mays]